MVDLATLAVKVTSEGVDRTIGSLKRLEGQSRANTATTMQLRATFLALSAAGVAVTGALAGVVKHVADHADALGKSAQKAGITVESLSRLEYAARLSDVSLESLTGGLGKLSRSMSDVAGGRSPATAASFKALGISVTDASGHLRATDLVLGDLADRFARMPDGPRKTAIAMDIFGKSGADLIPLLNSGATGLAQMGIEADRLGQTISTKTATAAQNFNDNLTRMGASLSGVANKLLDAIIPAIEAASNGIAGMSPEVVQWGAALGGALLVLGPVAAGIGTIGTIAGVVAPAVTALAGALTGLNGAAVGLISSPAWAALLALGVVGYSGPVGAGEDKAVHDMLERAEQIKRAKSELRDLLGKGGASPDHAYDGIFTDVSFHLPPIPPKADAAAAKLKKSYDDLLRSGQERIDQAQLEASALGMTQQEAERLRIAQELLNKATADGLSLTPKQTSAIGLLAAQVAAAKESTRQLTAAYQIGKETLGSFVSDLTGNLRDGMNVWDAFAQAGIKALDSLTDKMIATDAHGDWGLFGKVRRA